MTEEQANVILCALYEIERDFASICGCILTDRPDLPLSQAGWRLDFAPRLACIERARASVHEALQLSMVVRADENIDQQTMQPASLARCVMAPQGNRIP